MVKSYIMNDFLLFPIKIIECLRKLLSSVVFICARLRLALGRGLGRSALNNPQK